MVLPADSDKGCTPGKHVAFIYLFLVWFTNLETWLQYTRINTSPQVMCPVRHKTTYPYVVTCNFLIFVFLFIFLSFVNFSKIQ